MPKPKKIKKSKFTHDHAALEARKDDHAKFTAKASRKLFSKGILPKEIKKRYEVRPVVKAMAAREARRDKKATRDQETSGLDSSEVSQARSRRTVEDYVRVAQDAEDEPGSDVASVDDAMQFDDSDDSDGGGGGEQGGVINPAEDSEEDFSTDEEDSAPAKRKKPVNSKFGSVEAPVSEEEAAMYGSSISLDDIPAELRVAVREAHSSVRSLKRCVVTLKAAAVIESAATAAPKAANAAAANGGKNRSKNRNRKGVIENGGALESVDPTAFHLVASAEVALPIAAVALTGAARGLRSVFQVATSVPTAAVRESVDVEALLVASKWSVYGRLARSTVGSCRRLLEVLALATAFPPEALTIIRAITALMPVIAITLLAPLKAAAASKAEDGNVSSLAAAAVTSALRMTRQFVRAAVVLTSAPDASVRVAGFVLLAELAWVLNDIGHARAIAFKGVYLSIVRASIVGTPAARDAVRFLINALVELWGLDLQLAYRLAFGYIRQLGIYAKNALTAPNTSAKGFVGSWQFFNSLSAFQSLISRYRSPSELGPLMYPVAQISISVLELFPIVAWTPLTLRIVAVLNRLATAGRTISFDSDDLDPTTATKALTTTVFIPVAPYLLRVLALPCLRHPQGSAPKANISLIGGDANFARGLGNACAAGEEIAMLIRVKRDSVLKHRAVACSIIAEAVFLLVEHLTLASPSIGFPELVYPIETSLRRLRTVLQGLMSTPDDASNSKGKGKGNKRGKHSKATPLQTHAAWFASILRRVLDAIAEQAAWIKARRVGVNFGPRDVPDVLQWEFTTVKAKPPLIAFYAMLSKERSRALLERTEGISRKRQRDGDEGGDSESEYDDGLDEGDDTAGPAADESDGSAGEYASDGYDDDDGDDDDEAEYADDE